MTEPPDRRAHPTAEPPASDRLESWKEIAAYLKRDVRTVQRWELNEGLPVYRHVHSTGASVFASRADLDAWWESRRPDAGTREPARRREARDRAEVPAEAPAQAAPPGRTPRLRLLMFGATVLLVFAAAALLRWEPGRREGVTASAGNPVPRAAIPDRLLGCVTRETGRLRLIPVGSKPLWAAITPDGAEIYVANWGDRSVSVIEPGGTAVAHTIDLGARPHVLVVAPDGERVYVGMERPGLAVIDTATKAVRPIDAGDHVVDIALTPDGKKLYLAMIYRGLRVVHTGTGEIREIPTQGCPTHLAMSPNGSHLYVNYQCGGPAGRAGHDAIDVLDVAADAFAGAIKELPNVGGPIAFSPDGAQVWANGLGACKSPEYDHLGCPTTPAGIVNVIRASDRQLLRTLPFVRGRGVPEEVGTVSFFPDGTKAILGGDALTVIDTRSFAVLERAEIPGAGNAVFTPDGGAAFVPVQERDAVAVLDLIRHGVAQPTPDPRSLWPGDGSPDDARSTHHGEAWNGADHAPGRIGQGFRLDGVDDFVALGGSFDAGPGQERGSMSLWVKSNLVPRAPAAGKLGSSRGGVSIMDQMADGRTNREGWRLLETAEGRFLFCMGRGTADGCVEGTSTAVLSRTRVQPGLWYHVAVVKNPDAISLYINGVRESVTGLGSFSLAFVDLILGSNGGNDAFLQGMIDEVALYNRELSDDQVRALYDADADGRCPPAQ